MRAIADNLDVENNIELLQKQRKAKIGVTALLRAARKNDFSTLQSDHCPEIYQVKSANPKITEFSDYIYKMRNAHKE